ncbi:hypothetical protein BSPWISOXPB_4494 [uncultured Gammaproteobacteria bacterium]|nr:hypothetical protein BSPWISOXPB_4494 [uncultured Gammaproteobacteria bacterium]
MAGIAGLAGIAGWVAAADEQE